MSVSERGPSAQGGASPAQVVLAVLVLVLVALVVLVALRRVGT